MPGVCSRYGKPNGYTLLGHIKYYMPVVSGAQKEAADYYRKAEALMESQAEVERRLELYCILTTIAVAYSEIEDYNMLCFILIKY